MTCQDSVIAVADHGGPAGGPTRPADARVRNQGTIVQFTASENSGTVTQVHLAGRLDAAGADEIGLRLTATVVAQHRDALVDLAGVTFVASMGLRLLISIARGAAGKGHRVVLYGATPLVQDVLDGAALDQIVPIVATETEALAALSD
jgi:anti-sigma B factor antagonist